MPETIDALAISEEQQQMTYDINMAIANGQPIPPELQSKMFSEGFILRSEKFRALQIVAAHNIPAIKSADAAKAFCKANGYDPSAFADSLFHPILLKVDSYSYDIGGTTYTAYTWAVDGPYKGKA